MQLKTLFNRVTKYKPFVVECVELVEHDSEPTIEITMRARENGQPTCSQCGDRCAVYDTSPTARCVAEFYGSANSWSRQRFQ